MKVAGFVSVVKCCRVSIFFLDIFVITFELILIQSSRMLKILYMQWSLIKAQIRESV